MWVLTKQKGKPNQKNYTVWKDIYSIKGCKANLTAECSDLLRSEMLYCWAPLFFSMLFYCNNMVPSRLILYGNAVTMRWFLWRIYVNTIKMLLQCQNDCGGSMWGLCLCDYDIIVMGNYRRKLRISLCRDLHYEAIITWDYNDTITWMHICDVKTKS